MTKLGEGKNLRFDYERNWKWFASSCRHMQTWWFVQECC